MGTNIPASTAGGGLSTADAAYIHGWFNDQQAFMTSKLSFLTEFRGIPLGIMPDGSGGNATDPFATGQSYEGGAVGSPGSASLPLSTLVWQTPNTSGFGMTVRGKFAAVNGSVQQVGPTNVPTSQYVTIALTTVLDATKLVLRIVGAGTTLLSMTVADTLVHDYAIFFDKTIVTVYQDKTLIGSQATITNLPTGALGPQIFSVAGAGGFVAHNAIWGYVAP